MGLVLETINSAEAKHAKEVFLPSFVFAHLLNQPRSDTTKVFPGVSSSEETSPPIILAFSLGNFKEIFSDTASAVGLNSGCIPSNSPTQSYVSP